MSDLRDKNGTFNPEELRSFRKLLAILKKAWEAHKEYRKEEEGLVPVSNPAPPTVWQLMTLLEVATKDGEMTVTQLKAAKGAKTVQAKIVDALAGGRHGQKTASYYLRKSEANSNKNAKALDLTDEGVKYLKEIAKVSKEVCYGDKKD